MKKVKITVLRCSFNEALVKEYGIEELTPCAALREDQVFYSGLGKPEGFCDGAWQSKAEFARAVGKRPCEITKWLSGQHNFTLSTLAMLSSFFGQPIITVG